MVANEGESQNPNQPEQDHKEQTEQEKKLNGLNKLMCPGSKDDPELDLERSKEPPRINEEWFVWNEDCEAEQQPLGRKKKTTSIRCPECSALLEIRVIQESAIEDGEDILKDTEYYVCKDRCGYEKLIEPKRSRKKKMEFSEKEENFDGRNKKRNGTPRRDGANNKSGYRKH